MNSELILKHLLTDTMQLFSFVGKVRLAKVSIFGEARHFKCRVLIDTEEY